jgi:hypothetical protein
MRKLRKTGAVDTDGNVVTIPRLPSVTRSWCTRAVSLCAPVDSRA